MAHSCMDHLSRDYGEGDSVTENGSVYPILSHFQDASSFSLLYVSVEYCPELPPPANGALVYESSPRKYRARRESVTYVCDPGFSIDRDHDANFSMVCMDDGHWSADVGLLRCDGASACISYRNPQHSV